MRLLIFIDSMVGGGAERVSANLVNYWATKGWEITIVTLAPQSLNFYELHPAVKRIELELAGKRANVLAVLWQNGRRVTALRRVLRQIQPDIALGMMVEANVLLALAAWGLSTLRTIGAEHIHPPQDPLGYLRDTLRYHTYGLLNAVTALTSEGKDWIKTHTNAQRVTVIPNAVTWPLPEQEPRMSPSALFQSKRQLLLAVGRLEAQKGFDWLIEAFFNLADKHPDWDLAILGEGSSRTMLEGQVRESGLEHRIFLPGRAGNMAEWYESADLYVMSSRFEGFPMTLTEAMAHGLAAVSFDCDTGPRDIIRHELDGLLVPQGNVAELTAALDRLMSDALTRQRFAERAVEVRERFSMERIAGMWEKLFEEIYLSRSEYKFNKKATAGYISLTEPPRFIHKRKEQISADCYALSLDEPLIANFRAKVLGEIQNGDSPACEAKNDEEVANGLLCLEENKLQMDISHRSARPCRNQFGAQVSDCSSGKGS